MSRSYGYALSSGQVYMGVQGDPVARVSFTDDVDTLPPDCVRVEPCFTTDTRLFNFGDYRWLKDRAVVLEGIWNRSQH